MPLSFNPNVMSLDDGSTGAPRVASAPNDTSKMTDAEISAASIAAARELAMTPYSELSAAERASMTQAEKTAYIKAARDEKNAIDAEERAASNPQYNFTERPDAPPANEDYIFYYSWMGDTNSGEWKLYRAPNTPENMATYGPRSVGGATQAVPGNPKGANALAVQPQPVKDNDGNIIGWNTDGNNSTTNNLNNANNSSSTTSLSTSKFTLSPTNSTIPSTGDPATLALIKSLQDQITALTNSNKTAATLAAEEKKLAAETTRKNAIDVLTERFQRYGLGSLVNKIKELAIDGATEATITLGLQETDEYKQRFKANQERIKKGLAVLTPAEYLNVEDGYRQVLRAYGLKQFDNDAYVSQFIANDMSPTELSNRVVTAVQRVQNADPAVTAQLKQYYGIGPNDMVAYVLDPEQQFQKIERQVAASEIGVAAARQGLQAGVSVAEQLAAQGITQAQAQKGYSTIADILPTAEKLSSIYGNTMDTYGQSEGEQEVFNQLASAQRKREKLTARELSAFSGASGTNRTSLTTSSVGQF